MSHPVPFMKASNVVAPKALAKEAPDLEEAIEEDDMEAVEAVEVDEDEIDFKKDKYIKQPKAKKPAKKTTKKAAVVDDDGDDQPKKPAKGKASASRGKGKK